MARKDSTPPIDGQKSHSVDTYSQEQNVHDAAPPHMQGKEDAGNSEQAASSFGDMNISVAVSEILQNEKKKNFDQDFSNFKIFISDSGKSIGPQKVNIKMKRRKFEKKNIMRFCN